jgi:glutathione S-transferase
MGGMVKDQCRAQFLRPIFWQVVRTPPGRRDANALKQAIEFLGRYLDIAEKRLLNAPFLCGDDFTLADVQFGHLLYRYFTLEIERRERAGLRSYYERLVTRPAYREHVMVSYEELRALD